MATLAAIFVFFVLLYIGRDKAMNHICNLIIKMGIVTLLSGLSTVVYDSLTTQSVMAELSAIELYNLGFTRYKNEDFPGAIEYLNQALRLNPNLDDGYIRRGISYFRLKNYQQAINNFTESIRRNLNRENAYTYRGHSYFQLQNYRAAIQDFNQVLKLNPNRSVAYQGRGFAYYFLGEKRLATKDLEIAANLFLKEGNMERYQETIEFIKKIQLP
jgi:tetratricopeptide (TPR) repeat protein